MEIWKDIVGYNGHYLISNLGRVKSASRQIWNGHSMVVSKEKMLKPNKITNGYLQVYLYKDKKRKCVLVHRLVADAFIPYIVGLNQINHINGCKQDNRLENLERCDNSLNQIHAYKVGLQKPHSTWGGKRKTMAVGLLDDKGNIEKTFPSVISVARAYGEKSTGNICRHLNNVTKTFHKRTFKRL